MPVGRPKEPKRIKVMVRILPKTKKAIQNLIEPDNRNLNTLGKVVDQKFRP